MVFWFFLLCAHCASFAVIVVYCFNFNHNDRKGTSQRALCLFYQT
jgi:hypothetical protein